MTELQLLYKQLKEGELSPEAHQRFLFLMSLPENEALARQLLDALVENAPATAGKEQLAREEMQALQESILRAGEALSTLTAPPPARRLRLLPRWWAAAVLVVLASGAYWWVTNKENHQRAELVQQTTNIMPGREGAILTLADGTQVSLDSVRNATVALQGGVTAKVVDGSLVYEGKGSEIVYNTMTTPNGRQFQMTLPDGSRVWLNAASSIRYPTVFAGEERRVEITGEAYFEVASNAALPFRVDVNNKAEVQATGTSFNINAYENENSIRTTLLEGGVKIALVADHQSMTLKPGQQAQIILQQDGQERQPEMVMINQADTEKAIAWKNGLFNFDNASLEEVMRQLARWYDLDIVYENGVPNIQFGGKMNRNVLLTDLLKGLEGSNVHFRMENGRKLIVLP